MTELYASETGAADGVPVVLLHGFGGGHDIWDSVVRRLPAERRVIAFDLPGHGASLGYGRVGTPADAAKALLAALDARGIAAAHLAGHSLGGAAAALAGLMAPQRVVSLTLLCPGGFGHEINHRLMRRYAAAVTEDELEPLLEQFFGWEKPLPEGTARRYAGRRARPGQRQALEAIAEAIIKDGHQQRLPVEAVAALPVPVKVLWGTQDRVLPTRQAHKLPGRIAVHIFEGVGHMLAEEIPDDVAALIAENSR